MPDSVALKKRAMLAEEEDPRTWLEKIQAKLAQSSL
jgi:hypothetical protein